MKKKFFILLISGIIELGLWKSWDANAININDCYLNIFTPYHKVRDVFSSDNEYVNDSTFSERGSTVLQRQLTQKEIDLIAKIVQAESQGEPFEGKIGVAAVIFNRLEHPQFPKSVEDVVFQKNAFSCIETFSSIEADTEAYRAVAEALKGSDPTDNALYFYNPKVSKNKWMLSAPKNDAIKIGNHIFFK